MEVVIISQEEQEEFEYLKYFYDEADFGPADSEVREIIQERYEKETGNKVPEQYRLLED